MAAPLIQPSFAAGELSPTLFGRVDLAKFKVGAALMKNCWVDFRGGVSSRAGTRFVGLTGAPGKVRLVKFQFSVLQAYVLEFGDHYMRVISNGGLVLDGNGNPYVLPTPWAAYDLANLKFAQANDVMTFTHPNYQTYDLTRLAENNWQLTQVKFDVTTQGPVGLTSSVNPAPTSGNNSLGYYYVVTTVGQDGVESPQSATTWLVCDSFASRTQSIQIAWAPVPGAAYYNVYKGTPYAAYAAVSDFPSGATYGYIGRTAGVQFIDNNILPDFTKTPPQHTDPFAQGAITSINVLAPGLNYHAGDTVQVTDPTGYGFYGIPIVNAGAIVGVVIQSGGRNYTNPQVRVVPGPNSQGNSSTLTANLGPVAGNTPGVVTYYQQRKVYAASLSAPATYWASRTGAFNNMDSSVPPRDTDALNFTLAALEQNPIKFMIPVQNGLIMLTGGAAWLVSGAGQNTALTPTSVQQTPQVYNGCADVLPLVIGNNVLYVQEKGYQVQDLSFNILNNVFGSVNRSFLSSHLFQDRQIVDWCWAEQPNYLVWAVMSDGRLLTMTYIQEQEVFGWAQHEMNGPVIAVAAIPEGNEDVVYMVVQRPFGYAIERMASRKLTSLYDAWTMDCGLNYIGPPVARVSGLPMADGEIIQAMADGVLYGGLQVVGGAINLPVPAGQIIAGYAFTSQFQSLYLDAGEPTIQGKRKRIPAVTARVSQAKGMNIGTSFTQLVAIKEAPDTNVVTADERVIMAPGWDTYGQICIQNYGYPWSLLALIPEVMVGDTNG